jgi:hypothetical protein
VGNQLRTPNSFGGAVDQQARQHANNISNKSSIVPVRQMVQQDAKYLLPPAPIAPTALARIAMTNHTEVRNATNKPVNGVTKIPTTTKHDCQGVSRSGWGDFHRP